MGRAQVRLAHCPASNQFLLGATADIGALPAGVCVGLGTDSAMSGSLTLLDELRCGAQLGRLPPERLLALVGDEGARAVGRPGAGRVAPGFAADLVAVPDRGAAWDSLVAASVRDVALVLVAGQARLWGLGSRPPSHLESVTVDGACKYLPQGSAALLERVGRAWADERGGAAVSPSPLLALFGAPPGGSSPPQRTAAA
jgi:hypothetical protein